MTPIHLPRRVYLLFAIGTFVGVLALVAIYPPARTIGRMFEADGQLDNATKYYELWNRSHPNDYESRWHTAELLLQSADPDRAVTALEEMAQDWPDDPRIPARLVEIEDSLLRVEGVVPRLEALAKVAPNDVDVLQRLADHYRWFGDSEALIRVLQRLVRLGDFVDQRVELVDILLSRRRYDELIAFFSEGIEHMPNQVEARLALYQAYVRTRRTDKAIEQLMLVLEMEPARLEHLRELADLLVEQDRVKVAIRLYRARLDADPRNRQLVGELAELYEIAAERAARRGEQRAVILLLRERVKLEPTNVEHRLALAEAHGAEESRVAIAELRALLALESGSVEGWVALADRLSWTGKHKEAIDAFQRALEIEPRRIAVRRALAQHLLWTDQNDAALEAYRALVDNGGAPSDRAVLVELLIDAEKGNEALRHARILKKRSASVPRHRRLLAFAAALADQCEVALPELRWLTKQRPNDAETWYTLARCATRLDKPEEALEALRQTQRLRGRAPIRRKGDQ